MFPSDVISALAEKVAKNDPRGWKTTPDQKIEIIYVNNSVQGQIGQGDLASIQWKICWREKMSSQKCSRNVDFCREFSVW